MWPQSRCRRLANIKSYHRIFISSIAWKCTHCFLQQNLAFQITFQVYLPNINKMSMQAVLDYLYTKQLSPNLDLDPLELIALANRFCLPHLVALAGKSDDSGPCRV